MFPAFSLKKEQGCGGFLGKTFLYRFYDNRFNALTEGETLAIVKGSGAVSGILDKLKGAHFKSGLILKFHIFFV